MADYSDWTCNPSEANYQISNTMKGVCLGAPLGSLPVNSFYLQVSVCCQKALTALLLQVMLAPFTVNTFIVNMSFQIMLSQFSLTHK